MQDAPSAHELVEAVKSFLEEKAMVELKGHSAFHARVAANALGIVARELELGPQSREAELERLKALLRSDGPLEDLNAKLSDEIRQGRIGLETQGLVDHLRKTTLAKVAIDQPKYKAFQIARDEW
jgi:uncharacterized protein DUF6285